MERRDHSEDDRKALRAIKQQYRDRHPDDALLSVISQMTEVRLALGLAAHGPLVEVTQRIAALGEAAEREQRSFDSAMDVASRLQHPFVKAAESAAQAFDDGLCGHYASLVRLNGEYVVVTIERSAMRQAREEAMRERRGGA